MMITNFTWDQFWKAQEQYSDMLAEIEDRVLEIARDMGEIYQPHQLTDIFFQHDQFNEYIVAEMRLDGKDEDGDDKFEYYKVNAKWLFSDNYKSELNQLAIEQKQKEAEEYREYLRLKKKFEG